MDPRHHDLGLDSWLDLGAEQRADPQRHAPSGHDLAHGTTRPTGTMIRTSRRRKRRVRQLKAGALTWLLLSALPGCTRTAERAQPTPRRHVADAVRPSAEKAASAREPDVSKPSTLLTVTDSAYAATLVTQDGAAYLLTPGAAHRMLPDSMPMRWSLPLGSSPVLTSERLIYWHDGAFWGVTSRGGEATLLAWVTREPLRVAGSREHWVWLD